MAKSKRVKPKSPLEKLIEASGEVQVPEDKNKDSGRGIPASDEEIAELGQDIEAIKRGKKEGFGDRLLGPSTRRPSGVNFTVSKKDPRGHSK